MLRIRHLLHCVRSARGADGEPGAVVLHQPTSTYLGPGLSLTDRSGAVTFDSVEAAAAFLARYGSEPCLVPVPVASGELVGTAA
jgi:hypothetical protein